MNLKRRYFLFDLTPTGSFLLKFLSLENSENSSIQGHLNSVEHDSFSCNFLPLLEGENNDD